MKFRTRLTGSSSLIDLTPLVDVIFLLLIFFMITSNLLPLKSLKVEQPSLDRDSTPLTAQLLVSMDAQNVVYLGPNQEIVDLYSVKERLEAEVNQVKSQNNSAEPTIVLSVDKRVDYGSFLRLFSIAQECGSRVRLVYRTPESTTQS